MTRTRRNGDRRRLLTLTIAVLGGAALLLSATPAQAARGRFTGPQGPDGGASWIAAQQVPAPGSFANASYADAAAAANRLPALGDRWTSAGPTNIGGRVVDIAPDPVRPDTVYIAAATGGVWKSTDGGSTFAPAWPAGLTQSMGALAMTRNGVLYAGTGESNPGGGSITYPGTGVYRSDDGGRSWSALGLRDSGTIGRIAVDPRDPDTLFVAANGSLFTPGGQRGVYRSRNGGRTWQLVLAGSTPFTGAADLALDPGDPRTVYAALWDHHLGPGVLHAYGGTGSGIYRSRDGGSTWTRLAGGLPAPGDDVGRIGIGIAPSDPSRLYAIYIRREGPFLGFFTSGDGGTTWAAPTASPTLTSSQSIYGWWFGRVWVDPASASHVLVAGLAPVESHDGGVTWANQPGVHSDQHALVWDAAAPGRAYLGDDGGLYRSDTNGEAPWKKATVEPWTQFDSVAISHQDPTRISGGTQDNGSLRSWGGAGFNGYFGGDGQFNLIDPTNQDDVFACSQYGFCAWSRDGGTTMTPFDSAVVSDRANWFAPVVFDPGNPRVVYWGGDRLNRSADGGVTWTAISPDLSGGPGPDPTYPFGTITAVAVAPSDAGVIYAGTDDGHLWVTRDGGATWTLLLQGQPWVTQIVVDPRDADVAYASFSGYRLGSNQAHILRTTNGGRSWRNVSRGLPQAPVNDLLLVHGLLVAATDQAVFASPAGGRGWFRLGRSLPLIPVRWIQYDTPAHVLIAATFGRGLYELRT